ncbi:polysaccharide biosynthesis C-terminal domain-containing protein [Vibrio sp. MMG022]|uniref:lipopolysaccharide biosynthesis protein n=1 Tax=Vibrio sp. MMG023 TaxID=2909979 RepID=UPI001F3E47A3|nr:polysaccharide biosynthesis C-terminal domain-containing protein [Vibrio sp. MMG023]MCF6453909.1 polysaccharide biosynthesis C-terminal domain-containing protein [Vibrio sp. MMG023]
MKRTSLLIVSLLSIGTVIFSFLRTYLLDFFDHTGLALGTMSLVIIVYEMSGSLLNFGGGNALIKKLTIIEDKNTFTKAFLFKVTIPLFIIGSVLYLPVSYYFEYDLPSSLVWLVIFVALLNSMFFSVGISKGENEKAYITQSLFILISSFSTLIWGLFFNQSNFENTVYLTCLFNVSALILMYFRELVAIISTDLIKLDKEYLKSSIFIYVNSVLAFLYKRADQVMIVSFLGIKKLAAYYLIFQLTELIRLLPQKFAPIILKKLTGANSSGNKNITRIYFYFSLFASIVLYFSISFINQYFNVDLLAYHTEILLLLLSLVIGSLGSFNSMLCISKDKEKEIFFVNILVVLVQICTTLLLIGSYGILGAVIGKCAGLIVGQVGQFTVILKNSLLEIKTEYSKAYFVVSFVLLIFMLFKIFEAVNV